MLRNLLLLIFVQALGIFAAVSPEGSSPGAQVTLHDSLKSIMANAKTEAPRRGGGRDLLQFGGAFGGALLTSGSFTMMAASGGF